jgi:two-component system NtrC family sensor kinase
MGAEQAEGRDSGLDLLREVGRQASSVPEVSQLVAQIVRMTEQALKASASSVLLLDEEKKELVFEIAEGEVGQNLERARISVNTGIAGWVARHGKPLIVNDVSKDKRFCKDVDMSTGFVTRAIMCAPLVIYGKLIGVIEVLNKRDGSDFNEQDLDALEAVASMAAMTVESKRAEEALRISEQHYAALVGSLADAVFQYREGVITWCNDSVEEVCGYTRDELVGVDARFLYPLDSNADDINRMMRKEIAEKGRFFDTARIRRKNGQVIDVEYTVTKIRGKEPPELVAVVRDITERKRAEAERLKMEQQLQLAGRLAAVGELAAGVAHELNNPLAAVQGFAQFLASRQDLDETVRTDVETIYSEALRASQITSNLLSFARKHNPEKRLLSINDVVNRSLELHSYRLKVNNIEVVTDLAPDLPKIMADFHQMQQVFVNMITNAEQAMTDARGRGMLRVRTHMAGKAIRIVFADDGKGIPEENLGRIFDPFFTTKDVGKGTGLGLSICYGLVEEHGGTISVSSKFGEGTIFTIELPIVSEVSPLLKGSPLAGE